MSITEINWDGRTRSPRRFLPFASAGIPPLEAGEAILKMESGSSNWTGSFSISRDKTGATRALAVWVRPEKSDIPLQATGGWLTAAGH